MEMVMETHCPLSHCCLTSRPANLRPRADHRPPPKGAPEKGDATPAPQCALFGFIYLEIFVTLLIAFCEN